MCLRNRKHEDGRHNLEWKWYFLEEHINDLKVNSVWIRMNRSSKNNSELDHS